MSLFSSTTSPNITLLFCAIFSLIYMGLSFRVIYFRFKEKTPLGHSLDPKSKLFRTVRIHANFNEYIPFFLVLLGFLEISGMNKTHICYFGTAMLLGRIFHWIGLEISGSTSIGRFLGSALTFGCFIVASLIIIYKNISP